MPDKYKDLSSKDKLDLSIFYLRELIEYDRIVQCNLPKKILIEKNIRCIIKYIFNYLGICSEKPKDLNNKNFLNIIIKFLDHLIRYSKIIEADTVQKPIVEKYIFKLIKFLNCEISKFL